MTTDKDKAQVKFNYIILTIHQDNIIKFRTRCVAINGISNNNLN